MPTVTLQMYGLPSQTTEPKLLRVESGIAVVEGFGVPETYFRLSDGRQVTQKGKPTSWDFWRLSEPDRYQLRKEQGRK